MDVSMIEFLRTGRLGNIAISDTLDKVIYDLGEPDDISISRKPIIYKYGSIQFSFSKNTLGDELSTIHFYFYNYFICPRKLDFKGWMPDNQTDLTDFLNYLNKEQIEIQKDTEHTFKDIQTGYKTDKGVVIIFNENNQLNSIHYR